MAARRTWLLVSGGTLAALGLAYLATRSTKSQRDRDLDALASMLISETGFAHSKQEMAQIVFVALNRAAMHKVSPEAIVTPPGKPEEWNRGALYRALFTRAPRHVHWQHAREFAAEVVSGTSGYQNAHALAFVHPGGMPIPPCSSNRVATDTIAGERCLPQWAVNGRVIGKGMFA